MFLDFFIDGLPRFLASKPEKDKTDEDVKKPSIDDWEWKTMPSDSRWVKFDDVNSETITNIIMRMING